MNSSNNEIDNKDISISPNILSQNNYSSVSLVNDEELLNSFIGNKYEKINTKLYNIPGFLFNSLYMYYRKMFGYGILIFLLCFLLFLIVNSFAPLLAFFC